MTKKIILTLVLGLFFVAFSNAQSDAKKVQEVVKTEAKTAVKKTDATVSEVVSSEKTTKKSCATKKSKACCSGSKKSEKSKAACATKKAACDKKKKEKVEVKKTM